ncbi:transmembrane protein [Corynebacterium kutscheri]|uniref:Transmembrane protein n=1 Tax=Corynebacterium kutscheri TaxID=35755 RepID=A0A0F6TDZ0_9CORY|nr:DUF4190 domain-containing protein [Corynebacterium kutscheri]AKE41374.1 hypothetical protein UL82_06040 [Corynebacterium kutscheri]VEH08651.1 transmembrane protein [Corynebacterium kutscheri]VEH09698.1 transmembrane protein [Corynebacterium kutscheri]VEH79780.1 transmembrane protein [Corynebacterium kutscheri]
MTYPNNNSSGDSPYSDNNEFPSYNSYPDPAYGAAGGYTNYANVPERKNNIATWALGVSIAALVLTITVIGIIGSWLFALLGIVLGIVAIMRARSIAKDGQPLDKPRMGLSIASLIISVIALVLTIVLFIGGAAVLSQFSDCFGLPEDQVQQCIQDRVNQMN